MGSKQSDHHLLHPYRINLSLIGKQPNCLLLQNNLISIIFKNKDVCRSISNLKSKIEKKHFFNPNRKIMFNGVILNKLKL